MINAPRSYFYGKIRGHREILASNPVFCQWPSPNPGGGFDNGEIAGIAALVVMARLRIATSWFTRPSHVPLLADARGLHCANARAKYAATITPTTVSPMMSTTPSVPAADAGSRLASERSRWIMNKGKVKLMATKIPKNM